MMKKIILVLLAVLMLLSVCSCKKTEQPPVDTEDVQITDDTVEDLSGQFFVSDADVYEIETPYGPIYYPTKWKDMVVTEVTETDASYGIKFFAQLDGKSVPLYTVAYGTNDGSHMAAGTLMVNEDEYVRVYFTDHSGEGMEAGLTEASEETYLAMSEGINDIISNLVYTGGLELD